MWRLSSVCYPSEGSSSHCSEVSVCTVLRSLATSILDTKAWFVGGGTEARFEEVVGGRVQWRTAPNGWKQGERLHGEPAAPFLDIESLSPKGYDVPRQWKRLVPRNASAPCCPRHLRHQFAPPLQIRREQGTTFVLACGSVGLSSFKLHLLQVIQIQSAV